MNIYDNIDSINVKNFGAVGDGIVDDSNAFIRAIEASAARTPKNTIFIPNGKYNLNHVDMRFPHEIILIGENIDLTELLNSNITAPFGIQCQNITFNGGTKREFGGNGTVDSGIPGNIKSASIIIRCTPDSDSVVNYQNCVFKNAGTGSFAHKNQHNITKNSNYIFLSDIIENCKFENLTCAGIFHNLAIIKGRCLNNIFKNIGRDTNISDTIVAFKQGDTFNTTTNNIEDCVIKDNIFDTIISADDFAAEAHTGCVNMITIQGQHVSIINNIFKDLIGYGHDREGIYVKTHYCNIAYNYIEDAGLGEGYICCKKQKDTIFTDRVINIHDNTIKGNYGCAIRLYDGGSIYNNDITIKTASHIINAGCSTSEIPPKYGVYIYNNHINCGFEAPVIINGQEIADYYDKNSQGVYASEVVKVLSYIDVYIANNIIILRNKLSSSGKNKVCSVNQVYSNITIKDNQFYSLGTYAFGIVIYFYNPASGNINIDIENNINDTKNSLLYMSLTKMEGLNKYIIIKNNYVKQQGNMFGIQIYSNANNTDALVFDTMKRDVNINKNNNYVYTNVVNINIPDKNWVKEYKL